jgi:glycosyltransferase involved in cell wall biosynthesis
MRVALFTDSDAFAGTERHIADLALGLRGQGVDVSIACPAASPLADRARASGVNLVAIEKRGFIDRSAARILRRLLNDGTLDLVHSHNGRTALAAAMAVNGAKRGACVTTQHFLTPNHATQHGLKAIVFKTAHRWVNRRTGAFIAISSAARDGILERKEAPVDRVVVIPNGIVWPDLKGLRSPSEVRSELGISESAPLVVCAARLQKEKNVAMLVEGMKVVAERTPEAMCVIAGEGVEHQSLTDQIKSLGLERNVRLLGFRNDVLSLMNACSAFVLPSLAEPFGLVLLEAMALAKPVIATNVGGPLEIVAPGETGMLVSPTDPNALAEGILTLLNSPAQASAMGQHGRRRFESNFTVDRMAAATAEVYRRVLARTQAFG